MGSVLSDPPLNRATFERWWKDHQAFVSNTLRRLGVPHLDLADATQEVFAVVWSHSDTYVVTAEERTWLFAICLRVSATRRRTIRRQQRFLHSWLTQTTTAREVSPEAAERLDLKVIGRMLEALPADERIVFRKMELEDLTAEEVATALGIPEGTVRSRIKRARLRFWSAVDALHARDKERLKGIAVWLRRLLRPVLTVTSVLMVTALSPRVASVEKPLSFEEKPRGGWTLRGSAPTQDETAPQPPRPIQAPAERLRRTAQAPKPRSQLPTDERLARELKLLREVEIALAAKRNSDALVRLSDAALASPQTILKEERDALAIRALHADKQGEAGLAALTRFRRNFPHSPHTRALSALLW